MPKELDKSPVDRMAMVAGEGKNSHAAVEQLDHNERADWERLQQVSTRLISGGNVTELYNEILDAAVYVARADFGSMQILDEESGDLHMLNTSRNDDQFRNYFKIVTRNDSATSAEALKSMKRVIVPDVESSPIFKNDIKRLEELRELGIRAVQATPLISRAGRIMGMISTGWSRAHTPNERSLRMLDLLARQAADLFERYEWHEALRRSEEKYRTLFNSIDEGFCIIEMLFDKDNKPIDYRFLEVNPSFEKQTGIRNASGKRMREIAPEHEEHWFESYGKVALTGEPMRFEKRAAQLNRWYDVYAYRYGQSEDRQVAVIFNDITERKQIEEALRKSEFEYRTIFETVGVGNAEIDPVTKKFIRVNQRYCELTGYTAEELLNLTFSDITHPDDRSFDREQFAKHIEKRSDHFDHEKRYLHKNGLVVWVHLTVALIYDARGQASRFLETIVDITKRKSAEIRLRESQERLRLLMESFTDYAIFSVDVDGTIQSWNRGAENIFGYSEEEILGGSATVLFTLEDRANGIPEKEMETARKLGRASDERWHLRKDGTRFFASGAMAPLFDSGKLVGFAKIARDLTESKRIELELKHHRESLEVIVAGRTAELNALNASLRQEIIDRQRIESEKTVLLRRIVSIQEDERRRISRDLHDQMGQRLTALRLKIASLKEACDGNADLFSRVERLEEIGVGLDAEVNFLAFELRPSVLDDLGLVVAIGNFVREWSQHYGIGAEFHASGLRRRRLEPDLETNLYRIMQEALNNTLKHARAANASVLLEVRKKNVILIIEDDGVGFGQGELTEVGASGSGLGLIGMRERAALFGGTVEIESAPNQGTTIFVRIPAIYAATEERNGR